MAVSPGSLDYLYYNGILDHIPYEAYEQLPMTPSGMAQMSGAGMCMGIGSNGMTSKMNGAQYLQAAQKGLMYDTYTSPDTFVRRNNMVTPENSEYLIAEKAFTDGAYSQNSQYSIINQKENGRSIKEYLNENYAKISDTHSSAPNILKGLAATGIAVLAIVAMIKGIRHHK